METPKYATSELQFGKFLDPDNFQCWRVNFKTKVCVSTSTPQLTHVVDKWRWLDL